MPIPGLPISQNGNNQPPSDSSGNAMSGPNRKPHHLEYMDPKDLSPSAREVFGLIEFDDDERLLFEIRKHWFGLFIIYFMGSFVVAVMMVIAVAVAAIPEDAGDFGVSLGSLKMPIVAILMLLAILAAIVTAISAYLYRTNVILVTTEKLAQLLNPSLFNRKISQLSIGDVQDATVVQRGILPHLFKYGTITIESSGEQNNYDFTYAPNPYEATKAIINSHEENLKLYGN